MHAQVIKFWDNNNNRRTNRHLFSDLFNRITWVSQQQKGYTVTNLDFNEARDDEVAVASVGRYANHLHLTADR